MLKEAILTLGANESYKHQGQRWTEPHRIGKSGKMLTPAEQFAEFQRIQKYTKSLGSEVERRYSPTDLVTDPPRPRDVTLEMLMAAQTHMGHNTSSWNPANSRYIYGVRQGIHIISLEVTAAHLRRAARVVEEVAYRAGTIVFVGTRRGQMDVVVKAAEMAGACHVFTKWVPGTITNKEVILRKMSTKIVDQLDRDVSGFQFFEENGVRLVPDLVVCLNPLENHTMLYECGLRNVPTIGVIDTDVDPSWVTYTIPANDDRYDLMCFGESWHLLTFSPSLRSVGVIAGVLGRAGQAGRRRRLEAAKKGEMTWSTPPDVQAYMSEEIGRALKKRKEIMGMMQNNVEGFNEEEQKILRSRFPAEDGNVSEEQMMQMMGEAVVGEALQGALQGEEVMAGEVVQSETQNNAMVGSVESQLQRVAEQTGRIEDGVKSGVWDD